MCTQSDGYLNACVHRKIEIEITLLSLVRNYDVARVRHYITSGHKSDRYLTVCTQSDGCLTACVHRKSVGYLTLCVCVCTERVVDI